MRAVRTGAAVAVAALSLGAGLAGSASALVTQKLVITSGGTPLPAGTSVLVYQQLTFTIAGKPVYCTAWAEGTLAKNSAATDPVTGLKALPVTTCLDELGEAPGWSISGGPTESKVKSTGVITDKELPKMVITEPGPCVYEFGTVTAKTGFLASHVEVTSGTTSGARNEGLSQASCAKTQKASVSAGLWASMSSGPFTYELI